MVKGYVNGKPATSRRGRKTLEALGYTPVEIKARKKEQNRKAAERFRAKVKNGEEINSHGRGRKRIYSDQDRLDMKAVYSARDRIHYPFTMEEYDEFRVLPHFKQVGWLAIHRDKVQAELVRKAEKILGIE